MDVCLSLVTRTGTFSRTIFGPCSFSTVAPSSLAFNADGRKKKKALKRVSDKTGGPGKIGGWQLTFTWGYAVIPVRFQSLSWMISTLCLSNSPRSGSVLLFIRLCLQKGYDLSICYPRLKSDQTFHPSRIQSFVRTPNMTRQALLSRHNPPDGPSVFNTSCEAE